MIADPRGVRRLPSQERSSVTVDAILQAAAELFCDIGYDRSSTNRIAERAGVSIGSLYQYFANKEAILAVLLERHRSGVHAVVDGALVELGDPAVSLDAALEGLLGRLVAFHREDPELSRLLSEEVPHLAHGTAEMDEVDHYVERLVAVLEGRPEIDVPDVEISATVVVTAIDSLTRWLVHAAPHGLDPAVFVREVVRMLAGYLGLEQPE